MMNRKTLSVTATKSSLIKLIFGLQLDLLFALIET